MGQSDDHRWLVQSLMSHWERSIKGESFIRSDGGAGLPCPNILGYRPDLYHEQANDQVIRLGEAKTWFDIDRRHSFEQLRAYFTYLAQCPRGELHLSVEWRSVDSMFFAARSCRRIAQAGLVSFVVYGWAKGRDEPIQIVRGDP